MSIRNDFLALAILRQMNVAILRRIEPWRYVLFGEPPDAFVKFFHPDDSSGEFWKRSEMLDFFMEDAEDYFTQNRTGGISSGVWQEVGDDLEEISFVAQAFELAGEELIIVRILGEAYQERVRIVRRARQNLLERYRLNVDLDTYKQKARRDGLTGLLNRATFDDLLRQSMTISEKTGIDLSLILIDVDDFKRINDTHGHVTGDMVLSGIGQLLLSILRRDDAACRYGGEEFVILVRYANRSQVADAAEKIRDCVEKYRFDRLPVVTVSIGCSAYRPVETAESFINRVDAALYEAKRGGKNRVVVS